MMRRMMRQSKGRCMAGRMEGLMPFEFSFPTLFPLIFEKVVFLVKATVGKFHELGGWFIIPFGRACCGRDEIKWLFSSEYGVKMMIACRESANR